ncbi:helix-turn-helix domain-containing protein [Streptoalloteichus hindustanus]|uniref:HTH luxR-type domain-containing protein n=1 Tax=Streptoalloteichus hindustanus TaxID=2017 RepID=A0A1M5CSD0_STRHI|nr:hypothetical protein [Streptoalloteichus hindustanus]SHF57685.1 hypothetical protein SAMN05444320_104149 [Streptoalloteichus hindustanus]
MTSAASRLVGRRDVVLQVVRAATAERPAPVLITGAAGVGRGAVLAEVRDTLEEMGLATAHVPVLRADRNLVARVTAALALAPPSVLLLDDLDRADQEALTTLSRLRVAVVATYRTPLQRRHAELAAVPRTVVPLRPLRRAETERVLTDLLQANPVPELVDTLHLGSRGRPALLRLAVDGHRAAGTLRIVDRTAYLVPAGQPPAPPPDHPVLRALRLVGDPDWAVLKALAVLHPLGPAAEGLVAEAVGLSPDALRAALDRLAPYLTRGGGAWRFRTPLLASCLRERLGPWERRELSTVAVTALWSGTATCADPTYLPERLVDAADLVDSARAGDELLAAGSAAMRQDYHHARRWLRAAARRVAEPSRRATALLLQAATCASHQDFAAAKESAEQVLRECVDLVPATAAQETLVIYLVGLAATGDRAALRDIAEHGWQAPPGGPAGATTARAIALCLTGRWDEAYRLLSDTRSIWASADDATTTYGELFLMGAALLTGRMAECERIATDPGLLPLFRDPRHRPGLLSAVAWTLAATGEIDRIDRLYAEHGTPPHERSTVDIALGARAGRWDEALAAARLALATRAPAGHVPAHTAVRQEMAKILAARAQLTRARAVIDQGRAEQDCLPHVMSMAEAELDRVLGAPDRARRLLEQGLEVAARLGLVLATDELWLRLLLLTPARAPEIASRLGHLARRLDLGRVHRNHLLARVVAHKDSGDEVVRLVRYRNQPWELAETLELVAVHGRGDTRLLQEAYGLYGQLDALLPRARLRHLMRERAIPVPGRAATVTENERLLATLVSEGLTNRELAAVLRTTEKSVEGRLTRLFHRTGYRSRVELATAILTGEYPRQE